LFLLWKNKLADGTRQIALQELSPSSTPSPSLKPIGPPGVLLLATEDWEVHDVEGPFVWEEPGQPYLYLFYSGSNTWGNSYAIGVARARSISGPWTKMGVPLAHTRSDISTNTTFVSPGHNSVARKGGHTYLVYHAERWNETGVGAKRYMMVDRLEWGANNWPRLSTKDGAPSDTPQQLP
jgi:beta-xylosidase